MATAVRITHTHRNYEFVSLVIFTLFYI